jgi:hypothetical protein
MRACGARAQGCYWGCAALVLWMCSTASRAAGEIGLEVAQLSEQVAGFVLDVSDLVRGQLFLPPAD